MLYDESWSHAFAGKDVDITGDLHVQPKTQSVINSNGKKLVSVLHHSRLDSKHREKIVITSKDIEIFKRHKAICEKAYQSELETIERYPGSYKKNQTNAIYR